MGRGVRDTRSERGNLKKPRNTNSGDPPDGEVLIEVVHEVVMRVEAEDSVSDSLLARKEANWGAALGIVRVSEKQLLVRRWSDAIDGNVICKLIHTKFHTWVRLWRRGNELSMSFRSGAENCTILSNLCKAWREFHQRPTLEHAILRNPWVCPGTTHRYLRRSTGTLRRMSRCVLGSRTIYTWAKLN
jgi:hypothetical protein